MATAGALTRVSPPVQVQPLLLISGSQAVGYDNERGKGDRGHLDHSETPYDFISLDKLLTDFEADVDALRRKEHDDD
jgi:hypothetical protein